MFRFIAILLSSLSFMVFVGGVLFSCEVGDLPSKKTKRNCSKPSGTLDAQLQQRNVSFSISGMSGTIDQVSWDFGNSNSTVTTGTTTSYTYPAAGTYTVKAKLTNLCKDEITLTRTIVVVDAAPPTVSLQAATDITPNSASVGMTVTSTGNATITQYGICYSSTNQTPVIEKDMVAKITGALDVNKLTLFSLPNLQPNTLYYVRSFAVNEKGTGYSSPVQSFRTGSRPVISASNASNVSLTNATANFVVSDAGNPAAVEYGICYSSSNATPDVNNATVVKVASPQVGATTGVPLSNLTANTKYYYRSYAKLANGEIIYSPTVESFTTQIDTLAQDLIALVSFTNGDKTDASGNSNHVTFVDNPTFVADRKGNANSAVQLDGQNDYFYMPESNSLRPTSLTVSIWIKPSNVRDRWMQIYNKSRFRDTAYQMYSSLIRPVGTTDYVINTDIKQDGGCRGGVGWQTFGFQSRIAVNVWHHVVMTYSGRSARMYFDGALLYSTDNLPQSTMDDCPGGELKFGAQDAEYPNYFYGALDDIRIYRRALSASEVQSLYNQ